MKFYVFVASLAMSVTSMAFSSGSPTSTYGGWNDVTTLTQTVPKDVKHHSVSTLQDVLKLKNEGKVLTPLIPIRQESLSPLTKGVNSSSLAKISERGTTLNKIPRKVLASGVELYGYMKYSLSQPEGLYAFQDNGTTLIWEDPVDPLYYCYPSYLSLDKKSGKLKGYAFDTLFGYIFGNYAVVIDFETGELEYWEEQDLEINRGFFQVMALAEDGIFYGYGKIGDENGFISAPANDPLNYSMVKSLGEVGRYCSAICYNSTENMFYGIDRDCNFIKIDKHGNTEIIMELNVSGWQPYISGLTYDIASNLYYWNIIYPDNSSAMATIDPLKKVFEIYEELTDWEEFCSLFSTSTEPIKNMPAPPTADKATFPDGSTIGEVSFTLPSEYKNGTLIECEVEYEAYFDGNLSRSGSAAAGTTININYNIEQEEPSMHTFALRAIVNDVKSPLATMRAWIGYDYPLVPTNVIITDQEISWDAVTEGVHGGYIDVDKVTYDVYMNEVLIADHISETKCPINIDLNHLGRYEAEVVAYNHGLSSETGTSNSIVVGPPYKVPAFFAPTAEEFAVSTVYNGNNDGSGFMYINNSVACGYNYEPDLSMDAWYFLPPIEFNEVTNYYDFSFEVCRRGAEYTEAIEVVLCDEPSPQGVVGNIMDVFEPADKYEMTGTIFRVRQPGIYYIALHCVSPGDQIGVAARNFNIISSDITPQSPGKPQALTAVAADKGILEATVHFQFPIQNLNGDMLEENETLTATISGVNEVVVSGKPGDTTKATITTLQGNNTITVYVTDSKGLNSPKAEIDVYTGIVLPLSPTNLIGSVSKDMMSITLTWNAVTEGVDGGYIVPEDVSYILYKQVDTFFGPEWEPIVTGITSTEYTFTLPEGTQQEYYYLGIGSENIAGANSEIIYIADQIGTPYQLPMTEDFDDEDAIFKYNPWIFYDYSAFGYPSPEWAVIKTSYVVENAVGNGLLAFGQEGAVGLLGMPAFSTRDKNSVTASCSISTDYELPSISAYAILYGVDELIECPVTILEASEGYFGSLQINLPLETYGQDWVRLMIQVEFANDEQVFFIDSVCVDSTTGIATVSASENPHIFVEKNSIKVVGLTGQDVIVSTIDGKIIGKQCKAQDFVSFNIEKGIYVVNAGDRITKVVIK